jgi:hypothetical protein
MSQKMAMEVRGDHGGGKSSQQPSAVFIKFVAGRITDISRDAFRGCSRTGDAAYRLELNEQACCDRRNIAVLFSISPCRYLAIRKRAKKLGEREIMTELPAGYVQVQGTNRSPAPGATRVGSAEPAEQMSVSIRLRRRPGAPALPDPVTLPPDGGLTRDQFAATYGADPADIERVEAFGRERGLTVEEASVPRRTVRLGGTVAQMSDAFGVDLGSTR